MDHIKNKTIITIKGSNKIFLDTLIGYDKI